MPIEYLMEAIERLKAEDRMVMRDILNNVSSAEDMDDKWDEIVTLVLLMIDELEGEEE